MKISFFKEDLAKFPAIQRTLIRSWIKSVCSIEGCKTGNINIVFVSDNYLLSMNQEYLNHHYFTDIITFDYTEKSNSSTIISGDLFISVDTVTKNAIDYKVSFVDELHRVIIHGVLHLIGYKDKSKDDFALMKAKEAEYISILQTNL